MAHVERAAIGYAFCGSSLSRVFLVDFRLFFAYPLDVTARLAQVTLESDPEPIADRSAETPAFDDVRALHRADSLVALDRRLHALCRERGPLRAVLARIAWRLVIVRAWERIGYARLSDYAIERLGLSARWVQSLAQVGNVTQIIVIDPLTRAETVIFRR